MKLPENPGYGTICRRTEGASDEYVRQQGWEVAWSPDAVTRRDGGGAVRQRPWTHDYVDPDGMTHMTVKRCCNGCARQLGDATDAEMEAAVTGLPLPDVTGECGCGRVEL